MEIAVFALNPFQENTYVLSDETLDCIIIDPGMSSSEEQKLVVDYIESKNLNPVQLINTHCHIDHVMGNAFISKKYNLQLAAHPDEKVVLDALPVVSQMYNIPCEPSPKISVFLTEKDKIKFGNVEMKILFTPGHSPASISFYHEQSKTLIAGDVLFQGSIGRTDLPGGDFDTLINSIKTQFLKLPDDVIVYPGHGPSTTIGEERRTNPFLQVN